MEQRIGSSSQPLEGAGFDPAFIPGLTAPASGRKADVKDEVEPEDPKAASEQADADTAAESEENTSREKPEAADASDASGVPDESDASEEGPAPDGPVFEASDRRARIVADHGGVRLRLDDQECEFRWDEIGAVETETARFGKRYTVTVHTTDSRWYPLEVEAASRSRFAEWDTELDAVLDAYFDDEAPEPETSDSETSGPETSEADTSGTDSPGTEADAGAKARAEAKEDKP